MATWIAHLRIAENLLKKYDFDVEAFLVGNLAPDSGVPNEDWSKFDPPKEVTHWIETVDGIQRINIEDFYNQYIKTEYMQNDKEFNSFILGYYFHLITDIEWDEAFKAKKRLDNNLNQRLIDDPKFIWEIKKDWYGLDFIYLQENKDTIFYTKFMSLAKVKDYLEFFPKGAFERQIKYITSFYLENIDKEQESRDFIYLSKEEMDAFVDQTTKVIEKLIEEQGLNIHTLITPL